MPPKGGGAGRMIDFVFSSVCVFVLPFAACAFYVGVWERDELETEDNACEPYT